MDQLGNKIRASTRWMFGGRLATEVGNFIVGMVLARLLSPQDFGAISTVGVITGILGYFSASGLDQAIVRSGEIDRRAYDTVFTFQLLVGVLILLLLSQAAAPFAAFFGNPEYGLLLQVSGLSFIVRAFSNVPNAMLLRELNFRPVVQANLLALTVSSSTSIALAAAGHGPWALVFGGLVGGSCKALYLRLVTRSLPRIGFEPSVIRRFGHYGAKVTVNILIEHLRAQTIIFAISKSLGASSVGFYNRARGLVTMPMSIIGTAPYQAVFRALALVQADLDKSRYVYLRTVTLVTVYTLPMLIGIWWLAKPLIAMLYGEKWLPSADLLRVLALESLAGMLSNSAGAVVEARNLVAAEIKLGVLMLALLLAACGWAYVAMADLLTYVWIAACGSAIYGTSLVVIATRELGISARRFVAAVRPALLLGALLLGVLAGVDAALAAASLQSDLLRLTALSAAGALAYALGFLLLPFTELESEVGRLKSLTGDTFKKWFGAGLP